MAVGNRIKGHFYHVYQVLFANSNLEYSDTVTSKTSACSLFSSGVVDPLTRCTSLFTGPFRAAAFYPLNYLSRGRDLSMFRNPPGILGYVRSAPGPDKLPGGSYQFYGRPDSYIYLPNRGKLDTRKSISIIAWIRNDGGAGPIFHYMPNGWGVYLWMLSSNTVGVRFTRRQRRASTTVLSNRVITPHKWQYIAATYDYISGDARLYLDGNVIARKRLGRIRLATNYPVRIGAKKRDRRNFRGRISCVMVFDVALNRNQIARRKKRCFRRKSCCLIKSPQKFIVIFPSFRLSLNLSVYFVHCYVV